MPVIETSSIRARNSAYDAVAQGSVNEVFDAQAMNGHILDQTVWNKFFETEEKVDPTTKLRTTTPTARLNVEGQFIWNTSCAASGSRRQGVLADGCRYAARYASGQARRRAGQAGCGTPSRGAELSHDTDGVAYRQGQLHHQPCTICPSRASRPCRLPARRGPVRPACFRTSTTSSQGSIPANLVGKGGGSGGGGGGGRVTPVERSLQREAASDHNNACPRPEASATVPPGNEVGPGADRRLRFRLGRTRISTP